MMKEKNLNNGIQSIPIQSKEYQEKPFEIALMHATYIILIIGMISLLVIVWNFYNLSKSECVRLIEEDRKEAHLIESIQNGTINESSVKINGTFDISKYLNNS